MVAVTQDILQKSLVETGLFALIMLLVRSIEPSAAQFNSFGRALVVLFCVNVVMKAVDDNYDKVFMNGTIFYAVGMLMATLVPKNVAT